MDNNILVFGISKGKRGRSSSVGSLDAHSEKLFSFLACEEEYFLVIWGGSERERERYELGERQTTDITI